MAMESGKNGSKTTGRRSRSLEGRARNAQASGDSCLAACRFWAKFCCMKKNCGFLHKGTGSHASKTVCFFHKRGRCRFGDQCWNLHESNQHAMREHTQQQRQKRQDEFDKQLQQQQQEIEKYKKSASDLMSEVISCKQQLAQLQKENEAHAKGIASGRQELESLREENVQLKKQMSDQNDSEKHLRRQHEELREDVVMLKKQPRKEDPLDCTEVFREGIRGWLRPPPLGTENPNALIDYGIKSLLCQRLEIETKASRSARSRRIVN